MNLSEKCLRYRANQRVKVTVETLLPFGVFVRLTDGTRAYIRRREMSWSGDIDPRTLVKEGQIIDAVILHMGDESDSMELSHRETLPHPWFEFVRQFNEGDLVTGSVKDLRPYGVYVEILPGVNGLVPLDELVPWRVDRPEDLLWVGDLVEAIITRIHRNERKVWLSIRRRLSQLFSVNAFMDRLKDGSDESKSPDLHVHEIDLPAVEELHLETKPSLEELERVGLILVVEDQDELRDSLVTWLCERSYSVAGVKTIAEATQYVQENNIGVCFVDIDLPDGVGLSFIQTIRQRGLSSCNVVMSISEWLTERAEEIERLELAAVFLKPLVLEEIEQFLIKLGQGEQPRPHGRPEATMRIETDLNPFQRLGREMRSSIPLTERLRVGLADLRLRTRADVGIVFHRDPSSQAISIVVQDGLRELNEEAIYSLSESPVKDVMREGQPILETHVTQRAASRFRKLLDLLSFESCVGVPIEVSGAVDYALFLFHEKPHIFSRYRVRDAEAMATLFAAALESYTLDERLQASTGILLSGQLAAGFSHEVSNKISALEIQMRNIVTDHQGLLEEMGESQQAEGFEEAGRSLVALLETVLELKDTAGLFQNLTRQDLGAALEVNQVIQQCEAQLWPILRKERVKLEKDLAAHLPPVPASAIRLQQVFLNLILNAVQQIALKGAEERRICVETRYEGSDSNYPIKVRVSDTGPGIHKRLWERIFNLGFSSRPGGTGLGLFVARSLVENMGGRISVEKSVIPIGSTFLVELPAFSEGEQ